MNLHTIAAVAQQQTRPARETMPHAPRVQLQDGSFVVPQHYMQYAQTPESISDLLARIEFDANTLLFCGQDASSMYLQVGLIGRENYERGNVIRPHKLVYGRRWRIDADTPDAEIVQTALLAIKKAREHEVRELLTLRPEGYQSMSAALSNHQDLAVLQTQQQFLNASYTAAHSHKDVVTLIEETLARMQFGQRPIRLIELQASTTGGYIAHLQLGMAPLARHHEGDLAEFEQLALSVMITNVDELVYVLMDALIRHSDRHVEEHFLFDGFARFSRRINPFNIASLSLQTRPYARDMKDARFDQAFRHRNYEVDASRAARLGGHALGQKNRHKIQAFAPLQGHLPADL